MRFRSRLILSFFFFFGLSCPIAPVPFIKKAIFNELLSKALLSKISWVYLCRSISECQLHFATASIFHGEMKNEE